MGILLRILGVLWCIIAFVLTIAAIIGALADSEVEAGMAVPYGIGAFIGAGLILSPVWLTGLVFFLLPGWVRKQVSASRSDIFA